MSNTERDDIRDLTTSCILRPIEEMKELLCEKAADDRIAVKQLHEIKIAIGALNRAWNTIAAKTHL